MWHGRVKFKVTWLANQHQRWQRTKPTTLLLAFSLTSILAQRHIDLYLCVFQEAWSLPLHWPSWWHHSARALSAPSSLSFEPWVWRFNQQRVLGDKVENRMTNPLPDHLSLTLKPDPLLVNPLGQDQPPSGDHPGRQMLTKDGMRRGCPRKWEHKSFLVYLLAQYVIG